MDVTTPAHWLVEKSALRPHEPAFADALIPRVAAGRVAICLVTELEVGFSARSTKDFERTREGVIGPPIEVGMPYRAVDRARETQSELVSGGQHRAVAVPDLIVAAVAEVEGLTVLHYRRRLRPHRSDHRAGDRMGGTAGQRVSRVA